MKWIMESGESLNGSREIIMIHPKRYKIVQRYSIKSNLYKRKLFENGRFIASVDGCARKILCVRKILIEN